MKRFVRVGTALLFLVAAMAGQTPQAVGSASEGLADASGLAVGPNVLVDQVKPLSIASKGEVEVVIGLVDAPLSVKHGRNFKKVGGALSPAGQRAYLKDLKGKQDALMGQIRALGGRELGRVSKADNAIAVSVDASRLRAIGDLPGVRSIQPLVNYQLDLSDTVPYIGAAAVQAAGVDGTGVRVAVLDSGIDYTHAFFGGPGTSAAYTAAYGTTTSDPRNTTTDGLFPTAKVIGGTDFVGEVWPTPDAARCGLNPNGTPRACLIGDPDPIDCGPTAIPAPCAGSHGSHVADIIGGSNPGIGHRGVAPGASLYAVKVCSSVSTSCSGLAMLLGMDFALDPDGDGDMSDAVDVLNMSIGSPYGQAAHNTSEAAANLVRAGVVVACSAGNSADRPYITGSPGSVPEVIGTAQTQVPSATVFPLIINSPASIAGTYPNTATSDWAPIGAGFTMVPVAFVGRGCPDGSPAPVPAGGDPYLADPAGKVALIDRGACNISLKVDRAAKAGAVGVLLGLVAAGDAVPFAFGGGDTFVPMLTITQATSNLIKANIAAPVVVTVSPGTAISLAGSMVGSSSRGPNVSQQAIKPDIGAPGASVSCEAGSGTGSSVFGGTSGASPMLAGSAALLVQKYPTRTPLEIKSVLMNTAERDVKTNPATLPGVLAPITRIGGGEVRVNRAADSTTAAWDDDGTGGSLSFGYLQSNSPKDINKTVRVRNYGATARTYAITSSFRYADDAASGAVTLSAPASIVVPGNGSATFKVKLSVDPTKLPVWTLNGGSRGGDGFRLQSVEFDGYIDIADATDGAHLAWHILPHRSAAVTPAAHDVTLVGGTGALGLSNATGVVDGRLDSFSLLGTSGKIPPKFLPDPGENFEIVDLRAVGARLVGIGGGAFGVQFAINTFGTRAHPNYPAEFDVYIDNNRDGNPDFIVFNRENGTFASTGQNVTAVFNIATGVTSIFFFTDADLDSGNAILTAPLANLGLTPGTQFDVSFYAFDNYFTGALTDAIEGKTYTLGTPRFFGSGVPAAGVPAGGSGTLTIDAIPGGDVASPSQTGLLLMLRDSKSEHEAAIITVH
jgi:minor extracellular serine protease Vpr